MTELVERVRHRLVTDADAELGAVIRSESGGIVDDAVFAALHRDIAAQLTGAGPLEPLIAMDGVTDVLVNAADQVWYDRGNGMERAPTCFADEASVRQLAQRLAAAAGRRLDDAMPFVDAVLPDGTRLHAILPPLTEHTTVSLRVLARRRYSLADLVRLGTVPPEIDAVLRALIDARLAFVLSGGTGTGKTTLLGALLGLVPVAERLVVIEDAAEVVIDHPHVVRLLARAANVEGAGAVELRELVRQALRMRPDRLIVGEFRGAEIADLLIALNTGHEGGAATMHANSAADVPARFAALGALAGLTVPAMTSLVASAVDVVVHLRRSRDGLRSVAELATLARRGGELVISPAWSADSGIQAGAEDLAGLVRARGGAMPSALVTGGPL
ncbi:MAG: TadA family conjugal transfer-associated ATPase [Jatrophihabitantaceae bacterium]